MTCRGPTAWLAANANTARARTRTSRPATLRRESLTLRSVTASRLCGVVSGGGWVRGRGNRGWLTGARIGAVVAGRDDVPAAVVPHPGVGEPIQEGSPVPGSYPVWDAVQPRGEAVIWRDPVPSRASSRRWSPRARRGHDVARSHRVSVAPPGVLAHPLRKPAGRRPPAQSPAKHGRPSVSRARGTGKAPVAGRRRELRGRGGAAG